MLPPVKGLIENSLIEWEGQITAVIFLPGCNLRCGYCHAPHLVLEPERLETIPIESIRNCVARQRGWIDGVVITGGEPTLHDPALRELIRYLKGIPTKVFLETNGTRPAVLQKLIYMEMLDGVAMDVKAPLEPAKYRSVTAADVDIEAIRQSIRLIRQRVPDHEFKTTVLRGRATLQTVESIARSVEGAARLALQNFRPLNCLNAELESITPFTPDEMEEMAERARPYVGEVIVRGATRAGSQPCGS